MITNFYKNAFNGMELISNIFLITIISINYQFSKLQIQLIRNLCSNVNAKDSFARNKNENIMIVPFL